MKKGQDFKIIGASFGRTGTLSLKNALETLGFGTCYHMFELMGNPNQIQFWENAINGNINSLMNLLKNYNSMVDFPVCSYYKEIYNTFPNSKVILNYRDPEEWYDSISKTIFKIDWDNWTDDNIDDVLQSRIAFHNKKLINEITFKNKIKDRYACIAEYLNHIEKVKNNIPSRDLLIFDLNDGWYTLCKFLECEIPSQSFPHINKRIGFKELVDSHKTI